MNNNSKSSHFNFTSHLEKNINFRIKKDLTDRKYIFHVPDVYQLVGKIEESTEDCLQYFQRFKCGNACKVKICSQEKRRRQSLFYKKGKKIKKYTRAKRWTRTKWWKPWIRTRKKCFGFDSVMTYQKKDLGDHDIWAFSYCIIRKPFCSSKPFVKIEHLEENDCFLWFLAPQ